MTIPTDLTYLDYLAALDLFFDPFCAYEPRPALKIAVPEEPGLLATSMKTTFYSYFPV